MLTLTAAPLAKKLAQALPWVFFFGLFPIYFAYHGLLGAHLIPALLGGGWSVWTVPGAVSLVALMAIRCEAWHQHLPLMVLAGLVAVYALGHALFGADFQRHPILLHESLKLVAGWLCLYGIGYLFRPNPAFTKTALCALGVMIAASPFLTPEALNEGPATYQGMATSVVFVAMFCLVLVPTRAQPVILAVALATLFALTSRSDFLGFSFVALLWFAVETRNGRYINAAMGALAGALAVGAVALWTGSIAFPMPAPQPPAVAPSAPIVAEKPAGPPPAASVATPPSLPQVAAPKPAPAPAPEPPKAWTAQRNLEVVDLSKSQSAQIRLDVLRKGWADIKSSPFAGVYGGQMRDGGTWGSYIHMILSAWRQFGLPAFLLYLGLCVAPPLIAAWRLLKGAQDPMWTLTLFIGGFTLILVLFVKSVFWPLPALAWGLLAARR